MAPTILIVGGGFSGVALTHHLARLPWKDGARVVVADRTGSFGRGAAYSTPHADHLLNVPAGRMGALPADELHFLHWLQQSLPSVSGNAFVSRFRYGEYLENLFEQSQRDAAPGTHIETRADQVTSIVKQDNAWQVRFASGEAISADRVVLATGNLPPGQLAGVAPDLLDDNAYVHDPWAPGALGRIAAARSVLIAGTGLTMVDIVLALHDAEPRARFVAVSRRGLLPLSHRDWPTKPVVIQPSPALERWDGSARALLRIVRDEARAADRAGLDWRDVVNGLRPVTQSLWRRMPPREQARFNRHIRPFWDTHRHRMSTRVATAVNGLIARKKLSIVAGRIAACARDGGRVAVDVRGRDGHFLRHEVEAVVNCTGPCSDMSRTTDPLITSLRDDGAIAPDVLGIGIQTADDGAVIDRNEITSETMFTLGGMRRPALWESTAVPELRAQAEALARRLHRSLAS